MPSSSKNQKTAIKKIYPGLAIYKTGRSRFWHVRIYDRKTRRYSVKSTREYGRYYATEVALEIFHRVYATSPVVEEKKVITFKQYAEKMAYITQQRTKGTRSYVFKDQQCILYRKDDGLIAYFGSMDIRAITTGKVRDYLMFLDARRAKPLAPSTKSKQCIVIRQVLQMALDDGVIDILPAMPKVKAKDKPRVSFTDEDFQKLLAAAQAMAQSGDVLVRGVLVTQEHVDILKFAVASFLRPTETELFGLRFCDVTERTSPNHLEMTLHGKTGFRVSATLEEAVGLYRAQKARYPDAKPTDYVFMSAYPNRTTAGNTYRRIFNVFMEAAGVKMDKAGQSRSPYSLRHYALQSCLIRSKGQVNIYWLAENAGTSVDQLERFYLKRLAPSAERVRNIQTGGG